MGKVILLMHASLDGFVGGPNGELDWIAIDDEISKYVSDHFKTVDTSLYGRVTYQMMESYWPTVSQNPSATKFERQHAQWYDNISKIVFSRTLEKVESKHTKVIKENIKEEMSKLKRQSGSEMMIFGSPSLTHTFMEQSLIDEYLLNINPVILGRGIPLFKEIREKVNLKLLKSKTMKSGVVSLHYRKV